MKKIYNMPLCRVVELDAENSVMLTASGGVVMDQNTKVDQLSNEKDMWGNEDIWK